MKEFFIQVAAGLVVGFILGWFGKGYHMKVRGGRDVQGAQASDGAAAARDGIAVGEMHGGNIDHQIGDRHYGREESPEQRQRREELRKRKRIFDLAVHILRTLSYQRFGPTKGNTTLPGYSLDRAIVFVAREWLMFKLQSLKACRAVVV